MMYERLPPEPPRKEEEFDEFPEMQFDDAKPGIHNYLDEVGESSPVSL